jgi:hypothetical protein
VEDHELQVEAAQLRVLEALSPLLAAPYVLPSPDRREVWAALEQFGDELPVVGFGEIAAGIGSEASHHQSRLALPFDHQPARRGDHERPPERVAPVLRQSRPAVDGVARAVPGQDVAPAAGDVGRIGVPAVENTAQSRRERVCDRLRRGRWLTGKTEEMGALGWFQLESARDRGQDLGRNPDVPALLEPGVPAEAAQP